MLCRWVAVLVLHGAKDDSLARHTGQEEGEACHQLYCRLSILLQKAERLMETDTITCL